MEFRQNNRGVQGLNRPAPLNTRLTRETLHRTHDVSTGGLQQTCDKVRAGTGGVVCESPRMIEPAEPASCGFRISDFGLRGAEPSVDLSLHISRTRTTTRRITNVLRAAAVAIPQSAIRNPKFQLTLPDFVNRLASFGKSERERGFGGIHPLTPPRPLLESPTRYGGDLPRNQQLDREPTTRNYLIYG